MPLIGLRSWPRDSRARFAGSLGSLALQNLGRRKARTLLLIAAVAIGSGVDLHRRRADAEHRPQHGGGLHPPGRRHDGGARGRADQHHRRPADRRADRPGARRRCARQGAGSTSVAQGRAAEDLAGRAFRHRRPSRVGRPDRLRSGARLHRSSRGWPRSSIGRCRRATSSWARRRDAPLGSELLIFGKPLTVYGRLGHTGVGTHERGVFMSLRDARCAGRGHAADAARKPPCWRPARCPACWSSWRPAPRRCRCASPSWRTFTGVKVVAGDIDADAASARAWRRCSTACSP